MPIPGVPTGLAAHVVSAERIDLSWNVVAGATSYKLSRGTAAGGPYTLIATIEDLTYQDRGLTPDTHYYYVVKSSNVLGDSANSAQADGVTGTLLSDLTQPLPFGCRDIKLAPLANEVPGTLVDLPVARILTFSEEEDFEDLRGDDGLRATHGKGPVVNWELEEGGVSFDAVKVMYGGLSNDTGSAPLRQRQLDKLGYAQRPYFQVLGQAISDSGGDLWVVLFKCKAKGPLSGQMNENGFWLTGARGVALPRNSDNRLWRWLQHETATPITVGL